MAMSLLFVVTVASVPVSSITTETPTTITVNTEKVLSVTNPTYASFNIDSSYNRGFFHINFSNPNLQAATASLHPSTLRFGGGGNDYLHYGPPGHECNNTNDWDDYGCLNATHWNNFYNMVTMGGAKMLFGVSFDMVTACNQMEQYKWDSSNFELMADYMIKSNQPIWGFELGNEVNNRQTKCNLSATQQADAFETFMTVLEKKYPDTSTRPLVIGPDTGYLNPKTWLPGVLKVVGPKLHAVTHHVYPGVDAKNFNQASVLDRVLDDISWYVPIIEQFAPQAQIWAGEDGPTGGGEDGTCGTHSACGTYATVMWYADDMALRAKHGFSQYQRQDLAGGRYGLLGMDHDNEALLIPDEPLRIQADFWVNFLWKRVMGNQVLNQTITSSFNGTMRAYTHCGLPSSPFPATTKSSKSNADSSVTAVIINLDTVAHTAAIDSATTSTQWTLTPATDAAGASALLNGKALPVQFADGKPINQVPVDGVVVKQGDVMAIPALSVTFVVAQGISHLPSECSVSV